MGKLRKVEDEIISDKKYYKKTKTKDSFHKKPKKNQIEETPWNIKKPWDHINGDKELDVRDLLLSDSSDNSSDDEDKK